MTQERLIWPAGPELESDLVCDCLAVARAMNAYVEVIGQRNAKRSGTTKGAPDALLYCAGRVIPVEFKRFRDGRLSLDQERCIQLRAAQGVKTYIVRTLEEFVALVNSCRRALS